jgi:hypothetical protein
MRIFSTKKSTCYTQDYPLSPKFRETVAEPFYRTLQKKKTNNTTLEHVLNLFEEKKKYPPQQVIGPLPIKANGAIVVNRPTNHSENDISDLPLYLQDGDDDKEDCYAIIEVKQVEHEALDDRSTSEDDAEEEEEGVDILDLIHKENNRLRQQILFEREQNEKWRIAKEHYEHELVCSKQTNRNLQRTADRFEKLLCTSMNRREQMLQSDTEIKKLRRQSTGNNSVVQNCPQDSSFSISLVASYERKLQILLNEIEAMEQEQLESTSKMTLQKRECDKLARKLKYKDDIIRQLAYDLQVHSHQTKQNR